MAIIIPSKNIYSKQNPKIRDNLIDRVEIEGVKITPNNEYDTPVYNEKIFGEGDNFVVGDSISDKNFVSSSATPGSYMESVSFVRARPYTISGTIYINEAQGRNIISKIIDKTDDGNNNIKTRVIYRTDVAEATASATVTALGPNTYNISVTNITIGSYVEGEKTAEGVDDKILVVETPMSKVTLTDVTKFGVVQKNENGQYYFDYTILVGSQQLKLTYTKTYAQGMPIPQIKPLAGYSYKNIPVAVELTVYGDTIGVDLVEKTIYVPNESGEKPFSIEGNELMQESNYFVTEGTNATESFFANTLDKYKNGKETATIRCSISDYFNTDGEKEISIDNSTGKMAFDIYDEVIPYVYGAGGVDYPMSTRLNGSEKVFEVLGTKIYYDGAVWQELYLQEIGELDVEQPPYIPDTPIEPKPEIPEPDDVEPPKEFDMVIDNIYVENDVEPAFGIFGAYEPIIEVNDYGDTVFFYETLGLRIIATGITDPSELTSPLQLKKGQSITFYPYSFDGATDTISKDWKFKIYIPENTKGILTCNDTYIIWGENSLHWSYAPITIEFSYNDQTGVGTINARDKDGDGATKHDVDFSLGVTIEIK